MVALCQQANALTECIKGARPQTASRSYSCDPHGQTKLGFSPLPVAEAKRLKNWLIFPERFSALDPCVGDGAAFTHLLQDVACNRFFAGPIVILPFDEADANGPPTSCWLKVAD